MYIQILGWGLQNTLHFFLYCTIGETVTKVIIFLTMYIQILEWGLQNDISIKYIIGPLGNPLLYCNGDVAPSVYVWKPFIIHP